MSNIWDRFFSYLRAVIRLSIFDNLPNSLNSKLASIGFTLIVKRDAEVSYEGKVFGTRYKIKATTDHAIERYATARAIPKHEPINGIRALKLKNFFAIDIGANVGTYSLAFVGIGAKKVYSLEPGPLYQKLLEHIDKNQLKNIIVPFKLGLSSEPGLMQWREDENNPGNAHLMHDINSLDFSSMRTKISEHYESVEVDTLDHYSSSLGLDQLDLIKIDVEGMEWDVFQAGRLTIEKYKPVVVCETHHGISKVRGFDCLTPLFMFFYELGYLSYKFDGNEFVQVDLMNFGSDTFFIHRSSATINSISLNNSGNKSECY